MRATSQTAVKQRIIQTKNIIFYARAQYTDYQYNTHTTDIQILTKERGKLSYIFIGYITYVSFQTRFSIIDLLDIDIEYY